LSEPYWSVAFGEGRFVAVGAGDRAAISVDGSQWIFSNPGVSGNLSSVTYGLGRFVAVGRSTQENQEAVMVHSVDGTAWGSLSLPGAGQINAVAASEDRLVAVGDGKTVLLSDDVTLWRRVEGRLNAWSYCDLLEVAYGNGAFVAVGPGCPILSSPDGRQWSIARQSAPGSFSGIAAAAGLFVAVGSSGHVATSRDAASWTIRSSDFQRDWYGVAYGAGRWVIVGEYGRAAWSTDGIAWNIVAAWDSLAELSSVAYGASRFVAVGERLILTSTDGASWASSEVSQRLYYVRFVGDRFVATGEAGTILTSEDGLYWRTEESGTASGIGQVAAAGSTVIAASLDGSVLVSPAPGIWQSVPAWGTPLLGAAFGGGRWVVVGTEEAILSSP
jgi:hypothetical protein